MNMHETFANMVTIAQNVAHVVATLLHAHTRINVCVCVSLPSAHFLLSIPRSSVSPLLSTLLLHLSLHYPHAPVGAVPRGATRRAEARRVAARQRGAARRGRARRGA